MKTLSKITLAAAALTLLGIAAASPHGREAQGHDGKHSEARWKTIVIDVAVDGRTGNVSSASPTDTEPKRGATAILNGKIYPGSTRNYWVYVPAQYIPGTTAPFIVGGCTPRLR